MLAIALFLALRVVSPPEGNEGTRGVSRFETLRQNLFRRINEERASKGRDPLRLVPAVNAAAETRAQEIASEGEAQDTSGREIADRLQKAGYRPREVSEVILESEEGGGIMSWWRGLPTYRDLLREEYRDVGIGIAEADGAGGPRLFVFLFAVSWGDFFERETALLRDAERLRREMLARVNDERRAKGLTPLRESRGLTRAAQAHADDMARRGFYGHRSPDGRMVLERVAAQGYPALAAGENIAAGQFSVAEVMNGWMESRRHRENILGHVFTEAGFGVAFGEQQGHPAVLWVQVFGRPRS